MKDETLINDIRQMARTRVERLNSKHGQRMSSRQIIASGELVRDIGLDVPEDFDFHNEVIVTDTCFHNNGGKIIATDHSISRAKTVANLPLEPQFIRFGLGEFMSDVCPPMPQPDQIKLAVFNLPAEKQKEVYRWMHDALGCRMF